MTLASALLLTLNASAAVYYVNAANPSPAAPYTDWSTAATNIQDAVDAASAGDLVLVTNGVYQYGGRPVSYLTTNRVAVTKAITVQSANGPTVTAIVGFHASSTAVARCAYLSDGAVLAGFTLTNGSSRISATILQDWCGGGALCTSTNALITNCVITGNYAYYYGGGAFSGTLNNCTIFGNTCINNAGGGACSNVLINCNLTANSAVSGGGVFDGILFDCVISSNSAGTGGGCEGGSLFNCTLQGNQSSGGGGAESAVLNSCQLIGNQAYYGGGADHSTRMPSPRLAITP